ncbi:MULTISPECIES: thiol-disulfide oxidoreductase DCC family protein [Vibrio]|uniref:DUF393 domain-containing protein n=2 Tax=Vibrio TaxID=662 RepID=A0A7X4LLT6_9VIBR|nr:MULTISPECIES: DUF393 domain-containing protein [Vibrio]MBF9000284.1 DUF393 domain-containing protein [Vibrio nitrifigilis]MZI94160.1 DUF393 domain-containing protein [Vibrio eleionomae]
MVKLTLFFDGTCPLCVKEMTALTQHDSKKQIKIVDIYSDEFVQYPMIDAEKANNILHALDNNQQLYLGLDATYQAWKLAGKGWLYAPLRWPIIKPIADIGYLLFARNRYKFSYWLTGKSRCSNNQCMK